MDPNGAMVYKEDDDLVDILERTELDDDDDDDFDYTGVMDDDEEDEDDDDEEDLDGLLQSVHLKKTGEVRGLKSGAPLEPVTAQRPCVMDDFLRNFLIKMDMTKTLDQFNTEWYELKSKGKLNEEDVGPVPDIYLRNQDLDEQLKGMRVELDKSLRIAEKAQGTWDKFRKERDFHRMHHKRVVQEKNKLIVDIKRLKKHYAAYEPTLTELRNKYEAAMKEKMLMRLERDRVNTRAESLEAQLKSIESGAKGSATAGSGDLPDEPESAPPKRSAKPKKGANTKIPEADAANPFAKLAFDPLNLSSFQLGKTFRGHQNAVAALAFHPKKQIIATASDDLTWKMWSVPNGDLIMSGDGHSSWLSGIDFHPMGTHLATSSGDSTVKLWDFVSASCSHTFKEHTQAVWSVAFHHTGDFLVSCSMDHTSKLWDLHSNRCRQTFRGHVDSVNEVCFQPFSNNICTASGDKTVSIWDIRSGLCVQTFYGHMNACNHVSFNMKGTQVASCDADGSVRLWDVRMVQELQTMSGGLHPLNAVAFDRSGESLAAASDDGEIKVFEVASGQHVTSLKGHEECVQSVAFDPMGKFLVSAGSDKTFRVWN